MRTGVLDRVIGVPRVVYDSGFITQESQVIDVSGLDIERDGGYEVLVYRRNTYNGSSDCWLTINNVSTQSYGYNELFGYYVTNQIYQGPSSVPALSSSIGVASEGLPIQGYAQFSTIQMDMVQFANGNKGIATIGKFVNSITPGGSSVQGSVGFKTFCFFTGSPTGNMTSLQIVSNRANGLGYGSRFIVIAKGKPVAGTVVGDLRPNKITGTWKRVAGYVNRIPSGDGDNQFTWQAKGAVTGTTTTPVDMVPINGAAHWQTEDIDGWAQGGIYKLRHHGWVTNGPVSAVQLRFGSTAGSIDAAANYGYRVMTSNRYYAQTAAQADAYGCPICQAESAIMGEAYIVIPPAGMGEVIVLAESKDYVSSGGRASQTGLYGSCWNNQNQNVKTISVYCSDNTTTGYCDTTQFDLYKLDL